MAASRRDPRAQCPQHWMSHDWPQGSPGSPGVTVQQATRDQARIVSDDAGIRRLRPARRQFSDRGGTGPRLLAAPMLGQSDPDVAGWLGSHCGRPRRDIGPSRAWDAELRELLADFVADLIHRVNGVPDRHRLEIVTCKAWKGGEGGSSFLGCAEVPAAQCHDLHTGARKGP